MLDCESPCTRTDRIRHDPLREGSVFFQRGERVMIHLFSDGSQLKPMSAAEFSRIPVWNGNRILDEAHVATLKQSLRSLQDLDLKP